MLQQQLKIGLAACTRLLVVLIVPSLFLLANTLVQLPNVNWYALGPLLVLGAFIEWYDRFRGAVVAAMRVVSPSDSHVSISSRRQFGSRAADRWLASLHGLRVTLNAGAIVLSVAERTTPTSPPGPTTTSTE